MYRVYIGNLDTEVTPDVLNDLLRQHGIASSGLVVKRGYAFVDCTDSTAFEQAIERLNGYSLMGSILQVESSAISKRLRTSCLQLSNLPADVHHDSVLKLVSGFGPVQRCDIVLDVGEHSNVAMVDYGSWQHARQAFECLEELEFEGVTLKVEFVTEAETASPPAVPEPVPHRSVSLPLRILVPSDFIGAIIGRKGQTIRNITAQTRARIDVHGKENTGLMEKMISIFGQPENCSAACREIMTMIQHESISTNRGDITLRILIDDRYCGRIIGREGKTIKKIREDTGTRISISNVQEMASIYPDRVIAVRGTMDAMSQAEMAISAKLRECYERDLVSLARPGGTVMPSAGTSSGRADRTVRPSTLPISLPQATAFEYSGSPPGGASFTQQQASSGRETCHIGIPNYAVGAIIGAGGTNIKRIIRDSNAFVTVEARRQEQNPSDERFVTIKGNSDACWRASYFIFEKMKLEGFAGPDGDVRLRTIITIPQCAAGRVVGKGGKNVRDIQRSTGSIITLPSAQTTRSDPTTPEQLASDAEVTVEVYGNFIATQSAHSRIRSLVYKSPSTQPPAP